MKLNQRLFVSMLIVCALFIGCSKPTFHNRPSDKACIQWLHGQKIVTDKGTVFDDVWVISANTFSTFTIESISTDADGRSTAKVQFEMKSLEKILRVEGEIIYRHHKNDDVIEFVSFTPTRLLKLGKW